MRIWKLHEHISRIKSSEEMGVKYMQAWEEKVWERQEAREEGIRLTKRVLKLVREGKSEEEIASLCEITQEEVHEILED